jgi:hypothetical protein
MNSGQSIRSTTSTARADEAVNHKASQAKSMRLIEASRSTWGLGKQTHAIVAREDASVGMRRRRLTARPELLAPQGGLLKLRRWGAVEQSDYSDTNPVFSASGRFKIDPAYIVC